VLRLLALALLSGAGAVAVETVWMRWLRLLLGATAPAASATLVAFFGGHALGALWAARRLARSKAPEAPRSEPQASEVSSKRPQGARSEPQASEVSSKRPQGARSEPKASEVDSEAAQAAPARDALALYGRLELAGALAAAAVPILFGVGERFMGVAYDALRETPWALAALRFALALAATGPAAFCFGATFPALGSAAAGATARVGSHGSAVYAANTLGAALGTSLAAFWLPGAVGVRATYALALAALATAGGVALALARRAAPGAGDAARARRPAKRPARAASAGGLAALAALAGFCAFALQVMLVQAFAQVLNQSSWAFGAVLVVVLAAAALAAGAVAGLERLGAFDARTLLGAALVAAALAVAAFPARLAAATSGLAYVGSEAPGLPYLAAALWAVVRSAGPALFAGSLVLPLAFALAARGSAAGAAPGAVLGRLVAANTAGAIAGALAAPYLLLPVLGLWAAFAAVAGAWALAALGAPDATPRRRALRGAILALGAAAIAFGASPLDPPLAREAPGERTRWVETTPAGVVSVVERDGERLIRVDGHYALGGTAERAHHERQAHLPLVLAPDARRVAYVGSATGISAGAALEHPIESLALVELVPGVARAAQRFFADANRGVYTDSRTLVVLDDARNFLRATRLRFDVVVADLFVPWHAGAGALYAREHFEAVRARLEPQGLFCQWLPLYQLSEPELDAIAATFAEVFPRAAVFRGDFYGRFPIAALVGFAGAPPAPEAVSAAALRLARAGIGDRWVADPLGPWALYVGPLAPFEPALAGAPRNSDDRPWLERLAAAGHAGGARGKVDPIVGLAWIRWTVSLRAAARRAGDPLFPALPPAAARASEGGALLQEAGALWALGRAEAAARAFTSAASLLPPRLVADAPPDPTAADLWGD
jgi:spermidine synthase